MVTTRSGTDTAGPVSSTSRWKLNAMRTGQGLRAGLSLLAMLASLAQAIAQDATSAPRTSARPSVEERAQPPDATPEKPKETARESDTREAMCLMVEFGGEGGKPAAGILRARDLAGEPLPIRCGGAGDPERPARAGHRAVHAGNRQRAAAARSLRSRAGVAEIRRVPQRVARPVRQSRPRGGGL